MKILEGTLKTTVVADDEQMHVYEICREFDTDGDEVILLTLYPTLVEPNTFDLSSVHLMNHASDGGLMFKKVRFVFLYSKVANSKLSTKGLAVDEDNLNYLREIIGKLPDAKIVIAFGSSMEKCPAVIESKVKLFKMIKELRPNDALWQISADGLEEESPHILFCGIRFNNQSWSLWHYVIPHKYTENGYKEYMEQKAVASERFMQNVLGKKGSATTAKTEKPKKGKKKDDNTQS